MAIWCNGSPLIVDYKRHRDSLEYGLTGTVDALRV